ncbi:alpha/beta fold hydrolase [Roseovarius aestuariivivens]|uniref:alpha/beta fold hydrolase n=1 Tax=Roseovarius aestuariivivens TaxID=1888910 RepID=UPI001081AECF|nr:alpha/beta hydrolase [Roseovarius aestuariivivens]
MTDTPQPQEIHVTIDGLRYAGLAWGPVDGLPVLALHGWLDHAGSFAALAPHLTGCRTVALDLSGQGRSAHRSPDASYNLWDDLPQIAGILDALGWDSCVLLGHSRGANIGTLFAAAQPHRVRALVALDSLVPVPTPPEAVVDTLRGFIEDTRKQAGKSPRRYTSPEDYVTRRTGRRNSAATARALARRALREDADGFRLRADRRLFASSAVKFSQSQIEALLKALTMPVLNIWATDGIRAEAPWADTAIARAAQLIPDYQTREIDGDHHVHLDPDSAGRIADLILVFLHEKIGHTPD